MKFVFSTVKREADKPERLLQELKQLKGDEKHLFRKDILALWGFIYLDRIRIMFECMLNK